MRGIVDYIKDEFLNGYLDYEIVGSELNILSSKIRESKYINQERKFKYIKGLQREGKKIEFLADDSLTEPRLRNIVIEKGGRFFQPILDSKTRSLNWDKMIEQINRENIKKELMDSQCIYSIVNCKHTTSFVEWLDSHKNKIGILVLSQVEYKSALDYIERNLSDKCQQKKIKDLIKEFVYLKEEQIYLRSPLFYYWLPPYLAPELYSIREKWNKLIRYSKSLFYCLADCGYFKNRRKKMPYEVKALIYMVFDYLLESVVSILYVFEKESINRESVKQKENTLEISYLCKNICTIIVGLFEDDEVDDAVLEVQKQLSKIDLTLFPEFTNLNHYMRELDDNILIYKSGVSILKSIKGKKLIFTHIISFPYGGIVLGFFLNVLLKKKANNEYLPKLMNCHFSSKLQIRKSVNLQLGSFFDYIPPIYDQYIREIKEGKASILLYDNNTTTFSTIGIIKEELMELGNEVYGAAVSVNYENICDYLFDCKKYEQLDKHWQNVLDFHPVSEYITAFNTWGTSEKTKILDKIYRNTYHNNTVMKIKKERIKKENYEYKICRVHNIFDLQRAISAGATMVGIHAVYRDKINYYLSEQKYEPYFHLGFNTDLPIANLEMISVRKMVEAIPKFIKVVLVIEQLHDIDEIRKCCELYGLNLSNIFLQLQCRVTTENILNIKKSFRNCIISIGALQKDYSEYFWEIHNVLDPETDYILLDLSVHQPNMISQYTKKGEYFKEEILEKISSTMSGNVIPILIADDTDPTQMGIYLEILNKAGVYHKGIDMQNSTEVEIKEQKYMIVQEKKCFYLVRIRKSIEKLEEWKKFMMKIRKK